MASRKYYTCDASSLFNEYVGLLGEGLEPEEDFGTIGEDDALLVIDMQADFLPYDHKSNPHGGAFGVPEGEDIVGPICHMMERFGAAGAVVVACRDYHPVDHVCFTDQGGHLPPHCIEGSRGSHLIGPIAFTLNKLLHKYGPDRVLTPFKGFHEDIDSFGAFPYDASYASTRLTQRTPGNEDECTPCAPEGVAHGPSGCNVSPWTGCLCLKQSSILHAYKTGAEADMNAPPDVLAVHSDKHGRGMRPLAAALAGKKRLFVCGLAFDFCVLDTCLNAKTDGFETVVFICDAARPAHVAGIGSFGSGFLSDPAEVKAKMINAGLQYAAYKTLIPAGMATAQLSTEVGGFPASIGPLGVQVSGLASSTVYDAKSSTYTVDLSCTRKLDALNKLGFKNVGRCYAKEKLPAKWPDAPEGAKTFCWAGPMVGIETPTEETQRAMAMICLEISHSPDLRFACYGGFMLFDASGAIVACQTFVLDGDDGRHLEFEPAEQLPIDYVDCLNAAGRLMEVRRPKLAWKGAKLYCWVMPGEKLAIKGQNLVLSPTGGFLYIVDGPLGRQLLLYRLIAPSTIREFTVKRLDQARATKPTINAKDFGEKLRATLGGGKGSPVGQPVEPLTAISSVDRARKVYASPGGSKTSPRKMAALNLTGVRVGLGLSNAGRVAPRTPKEGTTRDPAMSPMSPDLATLRARAQTADAPATAQRAIDL